MGSIGCGMIRDQINFRDCTAIEYWIVRKSLLRDKSRILLLLLLYLQSLKTNFKSWLPLHVTSVYTSESGSSTDRHGIMMFPPRWSSFLLLLCPPDITIHYLIAYHTLFCHVLLLSTVDHLQCHHLESDHHHHHTSPRSMTLHLTRWLPDLQITVQPSAHFFASELHLSTKVLERSPARSLPVSSHTQRIRHTST